MKLPNRFGPYLLLERVSVGGMAEVYKAKEYGVDGFERVVAIKRILPHVAEDDEFIAMFKDEAKIAVQLNHSNIAQIYNLGSERDSFYIALEYVPGRDLRAIFQKRQQKGRPMSIPQACYAIMKICEGLDYAHNKRDKYQRELNIVHRDVSPPNILVSFEGEVKLIDFGVAKAAGRASRTQAGILKGKFGYMSPEQVRGMPLDRRSDVFSVGVVLYEILTGRRLFQAETDFATLEKVRAVDVPRPSGINTEIPQALENIIYKALAREPQQRYQSTSELHDALQAFMFAQGIFCSRKDLASWMRREYAREIELEKEKDRAQASLRPDQFARASSSKRNGRARPSTSTIPPPLPKRPFSGPQKPVEDSARRAVPRAKRRSVLMTSNSVSQLPPPSGRHADRAKAKRAAGAANRAPAQSMAAPRRTMGYNAVPAKEDLDWDDDELETRLFNDEDSDKRGVIAEEAHGTLDEESEFSLAQTKLPLPQRTAPERIADQRPPSNQANSPRQRPKSVPPINLESPQVVRTVPAVAPQYVQPSHPPSRPPVPSGPFATVPAGQTARPSGPYATVPAPDPNRPHGGLLQTAPANAPRHHLDAHHNFAGAAPAMPMQHQPNPFERPDYGGAQQMLHGPPPGASYGAPPPPHQGSGFTPGPIAYSSGGQPAYPTGPHQHLTVQPSGPLAFGHHHGPIHGQLSGAALSAVDYEERPGRQSNAIVAVAVVVVLLLAMTGGGLWYWAQLEPHANTDGVSVAAAAPAAASAAVRLSTNPPDTQVYVDGNLVTGVSPFSVTALVPGKHVVKVTKDGYLPYQSELDVGAGNSELAVKLDPRDVMLQLDSTPRGASIYLVADGKEVPIGTGGGQPYRLSRSPEVQYEIEARKAGYVTHRQPLEFTGADEQTIEVRLEPSQRDSRADESQPNDGAGQDSEPSRPRATTTKRSTRPTPARTKPKAERPKPSPAKSRDDDDSAADDPPASPPRKTEAKTASLSIGGRPGSKPATVYLDGDPLGVGTILNRPVTSGRHNVKWVWPDGTQAQRSIKVKEGSNKVFPPPE